MDRSIPPGRVAGTLTPPCSKSYAQRALAASLLCDGVSTLHNLGFCDDTRSALRCIETLGARVKHVDASTLSIEGGLHPRGKVLHVGESGLATRLFTPIASLCGMPVTIEGQGTLLRRPMHMMIDPLRRLGVRVRDNDGYLPFEVRGPIRGGEIDVDGSVSSQFITGLLLALARPIAAVMSTPAEAVSGTVAYLRICFLGVPLITAYNIIASVFRGLGDSKRPMYFIAVACAVNIALDYLFIGALHMGPAGAALGTTLAQAVSVAVSLLVIRRERDGIALTRSDFRPQRDAGTRTGARGREETHRPEVGQHGPHSPRRLGDLPGRQFRRAA